MRLNKKLLIITLPGIIILIGALVWWQAGKQHAGILSPLGALKPLEREKTLEKYTFENLKKRGGKASNIKLERALNQNEKFTSYLFSYQSGGKKITGLANIPLGQKKLPVVVMLRGYVDREIYQTGVGTQRAGEFFAGNGFITLAPDFLGYGESEMPPDNVWEERFLRPMNVLDLLSSTESLDNTDINHLFLWGHSNGGMIALAVLEISGAKYPTALWAPVSKFFPYDVLYYTDEADDKGKSLRKNLAELEKDYDVDKYSIDTYLDWLEAPLIIHQGIVDESVPLVWTNALVDKLKELKKEVTYYNYPGADHNMQGSWNTVVARDLEFFRKHLQK
jgi:dipeptidyl aminopeptidase/acylaminoacyl peptidase